MLLGNREGRAKEPQRVTTFDSNSIATLLPVKTEEIVTRPVLLLHTTGI